MEASKQLNAHVKLAFAQSILLQVKLYDYVLLLKTHADQNIVLRIQSAAAAAAATSCTIS